MRIQNSFSLNRHKNNLSGMGTARILQFDYQIKMAALPTIKRHYNLIPMLQIDECLTARDVEE